MRTLFKILLLVCLPVSVSAENLLKTESSNSTSVELRKSLVGTWHTKFMQGDGGHREEYLTVADNGTFRLRFLSTNRMGRLVDAYAIVGIWGVAEDIFFTSNLKYEYHNDVEYPAYLGDAHEFNAYRILEINNSFQRYQALGKNNASKLNRLAGDPCKSLEVPQYACGNQERIADPEGSNNGSVISLAE